MRTVILKAITIVFRFFLALNIFFMSPLDLLAAEVLQVQTSSTIRLGDRNRNYTVKLSCLEIDQEKEDLAKVWLRKELPRGSKVNLMPLGSEEGVLLARIIPLKSNIELSKKMVDLGIGRSTC